jgi:tRNA(Arg) A34 adenosine deaminase TadA
VYYKAKRLAMKNGMGYHLGAILWRKKKPVSIRANTKKGHPQCVRTLSSGSRTSSMHAEMNVLRFSKPGDDIEVLRWGKMGDILCSKPCDMCYRAMRSAGIRTVTFIDKNGYKKKHRFE